MFKLSVEVNEFARILTNCDKCIDKKPVTPILADILISKDDNGFTVTAANTETRLDVPVSINVEEGDFEPFCIEYEKISNAVSTLDRDGVIYFEVEDSKVCVKHKTGKFVVPAMSAKDYPEIVAMEGENHYKFKCNGASLVNNLNMAKLCVSDNKMKPVLCSVCLDVKENTYNVVSTSGFSMYLKRNETMTPVEGEPTNKRFLIPSSILTALTSVFGKSEDIYVESDMQRLNFTDENGVCFSARMIEGEFPNYEMLIPQNELRDINLDKRLLETMLRRASIFTDMSVNMIVITKDNNDMCISGEDYLCATSINEKLPILNEDNKLENGFRIGCNLVHLNDILSAIETNNVIFHFNDTRKAFLVSEDNGDDDKILLLMPMSINNPK